MARSCKELAKGSRGTIPPASREWRCYGDLHLWARSCWHLTMGSLAKETYEAAPGPVSITGSRSPELCFSVRARGNAATKAPDLLECPTASGSCGIRPTSVAVAKAKPPARRMSATQQRPPVFEKKEPPSAAVIGDPATSPTTSAKARRLRLTGYVQTGREEQNSTPRCYAVLGEMRLRRSDRTTTSHWCAIAASKPEADLQRRLRKLLRQEYLSTERASLQHQLWQAPRKKQCDFLQRRNRLHINRPSGDPSIALVRRERESPERCATPAQAICHPQAHSSPMSCRPVFYTKRERGVEVQESSFRGARDSRRGIVVAKDPTPSMQVGCRRLPRTSLAAALSASVQPSRSNRSRAIGVAKLEFENAESSPRGCIIISDSSSDSCTSSCQKKPPAGAVKQERSGHATVRLSRKNMGLGDMRPPCRRRRGTSCGGGSSDSSITWGRSNSKSRPDSSVEPDMGQALPCPGPANITRRVGEITEEPRVTQLVHQAQLRATQERLVQGREKPQGTCGRLSVTAYNKEPGVASAARRAPSLRRQATDAVDFSLARVTSGSEGPKEDDWPECAVSMLGPDIFDRIKEEPYAAKTLCAHGLEKEKTSFEWRLSASLISHWPCLLMHRPCALFPLSLVLQTTGALDIQNFGNVIIPPHVAPQ